MELRLRLQRFIIEDRLVGAINRSLRFLARSFSDADAADNPLVGWNLSTKRESKRFAAGSAVANAGAAAKAAEDSDSESMHSACSDMNVSGNLSGVISGAADEAPGATSSVLPLAAVV